MGDSAAKSKLLEMDLYKLFDVEETASIEKIKKAYRKKALELHPDKNLGNKEEAEEKFVQIGKAFEILADKSARSAYDAVRRQKREKAKRDELLDGKRRKLKEDLETREKAAKDKFEVQTTVIKKNKEEERLNDEIERLRKEGSKLLEEEINYINEQIRRENMKTKRVDEDRNKSTLEPSMQPPRIKITWSKNPTAIDHDHDLLNYLFSKYGEIEVLVVSKKSSAILEYKTYEDAIKCLNDERNLNENYSIKLKCIGENLSKTSEDSPSVSSKDHLNNKKKESNSQNEDNSVDVNLNNFEEMELLILKKLKSTS